MQTCQNINVHVVDTDKLYVEKYMIINGFHEKSDLLWCTVPILS